MKVTQKPKISIITATYNADNCLENLIYSIINQKNEDIEFIIIDGGSTDSTIEIIRRHSASIDNWVSEKDQGIYDAWNKGIEIANGEWIMFLGADDILYSNAIENYLNFLNTIPNNKIDYISGYVNYVDSYGKTLKILGSNNQWSKMRKNMCVAHVGSLHNKMLFKRVGNYDLKYRICGDYELLLREKQNLRMLFINTTIAQMKSGGISFSINAIKETFLIRNKHNTVSILQNCFLLLNGIIAYTIFKLKNKYFAHEKSY